MPENLPGRYNYVRRNNNECGPEEALMTQSVPAALNEGKINIMPLHVYKTTKIPFITIPTVYIACKILAEG